CKSGPACVDNTRCDGTGSCAKCVLDVAFGAHAGCVLKYDGTVWCAGDNLLGQLGSGTTGPAVAKWTQARDATGVITDATAVASGKDNTCALRSGGSVWCWGDTIGNAAVQTVKTDTTPLTGIVEIGLGLAHRCGRDANGGVWCWGANGGGQLGDGTTTLRPT